MEQQIAYCTTADGVRIAYATYGNAAAPPLVYISEAPGQEAIWASPWGRRFFEDLGRHRRLITFDFRGHSASEREVDVSRPEGRVADVAAVVARLHLDRFELFSPGPVAGVAAVIYASTEPGRVLKLVLFDPSIASSRAVASGAESVRASYPLFLRGFATVYFPSGPPEVQRWLSTTCRASVSAENMAAAFSWKFDLTPILAHLTMPVLILHRKRSQMVDSAQVRYVASLIPGARLVTLDGDAWVPYWDYEQYIGTLYEFLGIEREMQTTAHPSGMTAILFADIVDSTAQTERMGDTAFRVKARDLDASLRSIIAEAGGSTIDAKTLGDGVLATFSAASQAIEAALRCVAAGDAQRLPLHLGIHAGDVIRESNNVFGGAVNIASRISALSAPGELLVSQTIRDLARTSAGVDFEDRGEHEMKGIAEPQRLYAVRAR